MSTAEIYISVDVKTSGPFPPDYSMLSIGACVAGSIETSFYAELKPTGTQALAKAIEVVGKPLDYFVECGREPRVVMAQFEEWIVSNSGGRTPVAVGFNAAFDWAFVNWYFHTYLGKNPFGVAPIDIKSLFLGLRGGRWKDTISSRIPDRFKGPAKQTHHALDDAISQAQMFERIFGCAQSHQPKGV